MTDRLAVPAPGEAPLSVGSVAGSATPSRVNLLGCPVDVLTLDETVAEVKRIIAKRTPHQHCVVNAGKMVLMERDPVLKEIVHGCPLINADGQSVVWALQLLGRAIPERVTGIDLMERLFIEADREAYRVFFLGARQDVLDKVLAHVREKFPGLIIAGNRHGYFSESEEAAVVDAVARSNSDVLFVAMGSPKKEYWIARHLSRLGVPFCMGVGGSFDVVAGKARRAPRWIQKAGMEWFYRFAQEPRRLWRRYLLDNFVFVYMVLASALQVRLRLKGRTSKDLEKQEVT